MRWTLAVVAALIIATALFFMRDQRDEKIADLRGQSEVSVVLTDGGFEPSEFYIRRGTQVTFTTTRANQFWPASNTHPDHDIYPEFDSKRPLKTDESWSFVFEKVGAWGFHDHVRSYFTGKVYVEE